MAVGSQNLIAFVTGSRIIERLGLATSRYEHNPLVVEAIVRECPSQGSLSYSCIWGALT